MVLLLFGAPGCGKGTQSRLIVDWLSIPAISTGDLLRGEIKAGSELGKTAQATIAAGGLVSDDLVTAWKAAETVVVVWGNLRRVLKDSEYEDDGVTEELSDVVEVEPSADEYA